MFLKAIPSTWVQLDLSFTSWHLCHLCLIVKIPDITFHVSIIAHPENQSQSYVNHNQLKFWVMLTLCPLWNINLSVSGQWKCNGNNNSMFTVKNVTSRTTTFSLLLMLPSSPTCQIHEKWKNSLNSLNWDNTSPLQFVFHSDVSVAKDDQ